MRQSKLFTTTRKEVPADEIAKNARLLIRAGFVHKDMAGVYSFLPLGLRVMEKITALVRSEMNAIEIAPSTYPQEVSLAALQNKVIWEKSNRWDDAVMDNWFKTEITGGGETGLATTHEEPLTTIFAEYIRSYRDLPCAAFQFQTKFRNEVRAKSGIMRGREFLMKDLYSFSRSVDEHALLYDAVRQAYVRIFQKIGLGDITYFTFAKGGSFAPFSHEFQAVTDAGEDIIYIGTATKGQYSGQSIAINKEIMDDENAAIETLTQLGIDRSVLIEKKAVEVGNIFTLGTRFSEPLDLAFNDEKGDRHLVVMGSYGIGISRLMGALVEILSDDKGIVWPRIVAPYAVHLIAIGSTDSIAFREAESFYKEMSPHIEILFDDRDIRPGEKFADSDLIGIPTRIVISEKSLASGGYEIKDRAQGTTHILQKEKVVDFLHSLNVSSLNTSKAND